MIEFCSTPLKARTQQGGVNVELEVESQPNLVDSVVGIKFAMPNALRSITTHHIRTIPTDLTMDAPDLERIRMHWIE